MDKSRLTYKKLGEVATIVSGSTPQTNVPEFWGGNHYWVTPAELDGSVYIDKTERSITDAALRNSNLTLLPIGTVLLSSRAPIGKLAITRVPMYCNQGFKNIICSDALYNKYVYYYIGSIVPYIQSLGRGATFKEVSKKIVENLKIPVPSKEIQQQIVAELDEINDSISLLYDQVKDLNELAQSTFNDMFGDPVENEKGWEIRKLDQIATVKTGPFGSMLHKDDYITGGIPLVNPIHMRGFSICPDWDFTISSEKAKELTSYLLNENDVVFARRGDIGRCAIVTDKEDGFLCGTGSLFVRFYKEVNSTYILYTIRTNSFTKELISKAKGATMLNLNSKVVGDLSFALPPLLLQQSFADKVLAIEKAKEKLNVQIDELQTLLASRMQYWFD